MPAPATILLVAALLPLLSFGVLLAIGKRMGTPLAGWVATTLVGGSFLCSLWAMSLWYANSSLSAATWGWGKAAIHLSTHWLPIGNAAWAGPTPDHPGWLDVGLYVDSLTIAMFAMVTLVALLVHVFSMGYMRDDERFPRYFAYLSLFCFSMLGLALSSTLVQLFVFWELVGLCSYLLIGFWFERRQAVRAAFKGFIVNRVGDCALLVGFGLLFLHVGNASFPHLWAALGTGGLGGDVHAPGGGIVPAAALTAIGICLFFGAAGKSAQFPLHVWLPDAMEAPSPVSALIHAATMVAAGVYLMGRMFPILTPDAKLLIAIVGCITLLIGALIALAQTDIKRVLAFSTISQLGFMMLAIGVGSWIGALFHLVTHAFFKALLFLSAGSVIHASHHHEHQLGQFGGLWRRLPVTAFCFGIAVLAISGVGIGQWGFSGYQSKANILTDAGAFAIWTTRFGGSQAYWLLFAIPTVVAYLTAFYMMRVWMLTFWGKPRNEELYDQATESPMMYVPLLGLAAMSIIAGAQVLSVRDLLEGSQRESAATVRQLVEETATDSVAPPTYTFAGWSTAWPMTAKGAEPPKPGHEPDDVPLTAAEQAHLEGHHLEVKWLAWAWPVGLLLGALVYLRGFSIAERIVRVPPIRWVHAWLRNRMFFDELYGLVLGGTTLFLVRLAGWFDRHVLDGIVTLTAATTARVSRAIGWGDDRVIDGAVTGAGQVVWELGIAARAPQTGRIRVYVTALMLVVVIGVAVTVGVMMWR